MVNRSNLLLKYIRIDCPFILDIKDFAFYYTTPYTPEWFVSTTEDSTNRISFFSPVTKESNSMIYHRLEISYVVSNEHYIEIFHTEIRGKFLDLILYKTKDILKLIYTEINWDLTNINFIILPENIGNNLSELLEI